VFGALPLEVEIDTIRILLAVLGARRPSLDVVLGEDIKHDSRSRQPANSASLLARQRIFSVGHLLLR
jgi:hypothetical protein